MKGGPSVAEMIAQAQWGENPQMMPLLNKARGVSDFIADMLVPGLGSSLPLDLGVWHGTPHRWAPEPTHPQGRFRLDKIGTGEGAQAYGWGAYFAENPEVARVYREELAGKQLVVNGKPKTDGALDSIVKAYLKDATPEAAVAELDKHNALGRYVWGGKRQDDAVKDALRGYYGKTVRVEDAGATYHLDLPIEDVPLLDWDLPLSKQSDEILKKLLGKQLDLVELRKRQKIWSEMYGGGYNKQQIDEAASWVEKNIPEAWQQAVLEDWSGEVLYDSILGGEGGGMAASKHLERLGIPGLRYFDQGSRGAKEGTRNYVIWSQELLDRAQQLDPTTGKPK